MDKRVIFAVAGSGKTTHIINQLDLEKKSLIITYTNNNVENIRNGIIKKWGYFPSNIKLLSYFSFLHSFCFKPFLAKSYKTKGIYYMPNTNRFAKNDDRFISKNKRLYSNRLSKFMEEKSTYDEINNRLESIFLICLLMKFRILAGMILTSLKVSLRQILICY